ncbi:MULTISPECIES: recombinase family protein [Streptomyces]|uniref:recombinase family protein n=1 Tax=Streptomyces TaxID=1883 RepID=UPI00163CBE40|nr:MULTISPECIES: recombinase family protein [Streptomyces]MBC2876343.1 recombinase family protein [Streptomyces sp. TYQ1024]UBI35441.1 hypothetical protein K7I03_02475 [Streptomyces mobaraensis]UKW28033.1 hypothetical protein MCU78_02505 [Streptomyces sp. TYQ1024]
MRREDSGALKALGFSEDELAALGLDRPAEGAPADLVDVYIRRSKKREDLATLRAHLRDVVRWARSEGLGIRHVWFEQRSASKAHVRRDEFEKAKEAVLAGLSKTLAVGRRTGSTGGAWARSAPSWTSWRNGAPALSR